MTTPDERSEEPVELWDELVPDKPREVSPQVEDWVTFDPDESFGERYVGGDMEMWVQFRTRVGVGDPQCWLAVFQALRAPGIPDVRSGKVDWIAPGTNREHGEQQVAMLVDDIQFVDFPQEFTVVPSAVWLYALDNCQRVRMDATSYLTWPRLDLLAEGIESVGGEVNGKLRCEDGRVAVRDDELPRQVIKRRPQTVDRVAEHQTPSGIDYRRVERIIEMVDSISVYFALEGIGAGVTNECRLPLQLVEVFYRSINLGEHAIEGRLIAALPTHLVLWDGDGRNRGTETDDAGGGGA